MTHGTCWASIRLEDDPLRRSLSQTSSSAARTWGIFWFAFSSRSTIVTGWLRGVLSSGAAAILRCEALERPSQNPAASGGQIFEDFGGRWGFVVNSADFVGGEVFVVKCLQSEGGSCRVMAVYPKLRQDFAPCQLLFRDLVVSAMLDNAVEELVEIDVGGINLGFGVEPGASVCVEFPELCDKIFVLRSSVNEVFGNPVGRRHRGRLRPQGRRNRDPPDDASQNSRRIEVDVVVVR